MAKLAKSSKRGAPPGQRRGGRQKGTPNKTTAEARQAIATLLEGRIDRLCNLLDRVEEDDPARALGLYLQLLEYYVPKFARRNDSFFPNPFLKE